MHFQTLAMDASCFRLPVYPNKSRNTFSLDKSKCSATLDMIALRVPTFKGL
jgi:hypothetical protein